MLYFRNQRCVDPNKWSYPHPNGWVSLISLVCYSRLKRRRRRSRHAFVPPPVVGAVVAPLVVGADVARPQPVVGAVVPQFLGRVDWRIHFQNIPAFPVASLGNARPLDSNYIDVGTETHGWIARTHIQTDRAGDVLT